MSWLEIVGLIALSPVALFLGLIGLYIVLFIIAFLVACVIYCLEALRDKLKRKKR